MSLLMIFLDFVFEDLAKWAGGWGRYGPMPRLDDIGRSVLRTGDGRFITAPLGAHPGFKLHDTSDV